MSIERVTLAPDRAGWRLDRALADALPQLSRERLKRLVAAGAVAGPAGPVRDPAFRVRGGEALTVSVPVARAADARPQDIPLAIVHEDEHLLVVDKPAGLVVHPAAGNPDGTMVNALLHHCAGGLSGIGGVARPGIVHRIDKDTSGLLVVAKTDRAHEGLARQFAEHRVERSYVAVVVGHPVPPAGGIDTRLGRSSSDRKKMAVVASGGKRAVTRYRTMERLRDAAVISCELETGRTHQIRVHMASIGHPLVGDPVYGGAQARLRERLRAIGFARQALHAATLGFSHPVIGGKIRLESPIPSDIQELIGFLSV